MKRYICNHCGVTEPPQTSHDTAPVGWFTVRQMGGQTTTDGKTEFRPYGESLDLCSPACVIGTMQQQIRTETDRQLAQMPPAEITPDDIARAIAGPTPAGMAGSPETDDRLD